MQHPGIDGPASPVSTQPLPDRQRLDTLMARARELEAAFLSEMLSLAGLGDVQGEFSGGIGEQQFASFLRDAQARAIVDTGGIGLAQRLFESMTRNDHAGE